ncbi:MAG: hypothetical protein ACK5XA_14660 [Tagaea sp.]
MNRRSFVFALGGLLGASSIAHAQQGQGQSQTRGNQGGETRGRERADEVRERNQDRRDDRRESRPERREDRCERRDERRESRGERRENRPQSQGNRN